MNRSLRTVIVAGGLAALGVAATADRAAAQNPFGYPGYPSMPTYGHGYSSSYQSGYSSPYFSGMHGYSSGYQSGYSSPYFSGMHGYSSGYQSGFYSYPGMIYPTPRSNIWTGSYYVSPGTFWRLRGR